MLQVGHSTMNLCFRKYFNQLMSKILADFICLIANFKVLGVLKVAKQGFNPSLLGVVDQRILHGEDLFPPSLSYS